MEEGGYVVIVHPCTDTYREYTLKDISDYYRPLALITNREVSWENRYVGHVMHVKEYGYEELKGAIELFEKTHPVAGIITYFEDITDVTARVASRLGYRGISERAALAVRDKYVMRQRLRECGVPVPDFRLVRKLSEAEDFVAKNGYPVVLKPAHGSASIGVVKACDPTELEDYFSHVYEISINEYGFGALLVEEYVGGLEVSVESVVYDGEVHVVMVTDKEKGEEPFFIETGHTVPSQLSEEILSQIREATVEANKQLGVENGITHTEIKWTPETGPKIIEIGGRLAGDFIPLIVYRATGINLNRALTDVCLGREPELRQKEESCCAVRFMLPKDSGILLGYERSEEVLKREGIERWAFWGTIGNRVMKPPHKYTNRIGYYIVKEKNYSALKEKLERIEKAVKVEIL